MAQCVKSFGITQKKRGGESKKNNFQIKEKKKNRPNNNEMKLEK